MLPFSSSSWRTGDKEGMYTEIWQPVLPPATMCEQGERPGSWPQAAHSTTAISLGISGQQVGLSGGRDRMGVQSSPRRGPIFLPTRSSGSSSSSESLPDAGTWRFHLAAFAPDGAAAPVRRLQGGNAMSAAPQSPIVSPTRRRYTPGFDKRNDHLLGPSVSIKSVTLFSAPESPRGTSALRASPPMLITPMTPRADQLKLNTPKTPRAVQSARPHTETRPTSSRPLPAPPRRRQPPPPSTPRPLPPPPPTSTAPTAHEASAHQQRSLLPSPPPPAASDSSAAAIATEEAPARLRPASSMPRPTARVFFDPPHLPSPAVRLVPSSSSSSALLERLRLEILHSASTRPVIPTLCTLHPTPYTLHHTPYNLHPKPYTLHHTPCTLHHTPYTLHPTPYTLHPTP